MGTYGVPPNCLQIPGIDFIPLSQSITTIKDNIAFSDSQYGQQRMMQGWSSRIMRTGYV